MRIIFAILTISLLVHTTGCSINHPVAQDYDAHLVKYGSEKNLPEADISGYYSIMPSTQTHNYQFRAATVGYAHVWIVEFGKILDKTLQAPYVQSAFGGLKKATNEEAEGVRIDFELEDYKFEHYRAFTTLNIKVFDLGKEIFSKTYSSEGVSQGGDMWVAGPFGMKTATLESTKSSIDKILEEFINDINSENIAAIKGSPHKASKPDAITGAP